MENSETNLTPILDLAFIELSSQYDRSNKTKQSIVEISDSFPDQHSLQIKPNILPAQITSKNDDKTEKEKQLLEQSFVVEVKENQQLSNGCQILEYNPNSIGFTNSRKKFINLKNAFNFQNSIQVNSSISQKIGSQNSFQVVKIIDQIQSNHYDASFDVFSYFPLHQSLTKEIPILMVQDRSNYDRKCVSIIENDKNQDPADKQTEYQLKILNSTQNKPKLNRSDKNHMISIQEKQNFSMKPNRVNLDLAINLNSSNNQLDINKPKETQELKQNERITDQNWQQKGIVYVQKRQIANDSQQINHSQQINQQIPRIDISSEEIQYRSEISEDLLHHLGYRVSNRRKIMQAAQKKTRIKKRQLKIIQQFKKSISIINDRMCNSQVKQYRWQIYSKRIWNTLADALSQNFKIFAKLSRKYKSAFAKYLPKGQKIVSKKQQTKTKSIKKSRVSHKQENEVKQIKKRQVFAREQKMNIIKDLFNKVQIQKVGQYEQRFQQIQISSLNQSSLNESVGPGSQYQPSPIQFDKVVRDIIQNDDQQIRRKFKIQNLKMESNVIPLNQIFVEKMTKIVEDFNFQQNINEFFNVSKRRPILSCLSQDSMGLRSTTMKVISREQYMLQLKRKKEQKQGIIIFDDEVQQSNLDLYLMKDELKK